ncbi:MAG: PIG-L deacetylase family protein [Bacillota bacterium]
MRSLATPRRVGAAALGALLLLALVLSLYRYFFPSPARVRLPAEMPLGPGDSILVIAPHSDDETLGPGGLIHRAVLEGIPVHVVMMTNGDGFTLAAAEEHLRLHPSPQDYIRLAEERQRETLEALSVLGVPAENVIFLGYPDRGLAPMWTTHWSPDQPYFSRFTQTSRSPYSNSFTPGALYCGQSAVEDLRRVLLSLKPTVLVYPHPMDAHPDHYATNAFTNYALQELRDEGYSFANQMRQYLYLVHRGDWPAPKGLNLASSLLPPGPLVHTDTSWFAFTLDHDSSWAKYQAILRYRSQVRIMPRYLESFARKNDLLGTIPAKIIPVVEAGVLRVGGAAARWADLTPLVQDPTADTLTRQLEGSADLTTLRLATDGDRLFLRLETRRPVSPRVRYAIRLRTLAPAQPGRAADGARARRGDLELTLRPTFAPVLTGGVGAEDDVQFAVDDGSLEASLPLANLGNPREIFVGAESFMVVSVDRLAWTLAPLPQAAWETRGPAPKGGSR